MTLFALKPFSAACFAAMTAFTAVPALAQQQPAETIRLVKVNQTLFYIPESMLAGFVGGDDPKFDKSLPATTVINARKGVQLSFDNRNSRNPAGDPDQPRPWEFNFVTVGLVDLRPNVPTVPKEEFEREHVRNSEPLNTQFNCNKSYYKRAGFDYCDARRRVLNGVAITYRWPGSVVDPATWPQMDRRVQKIVEWLATSPEQRPAKITD